MKCLHFSVKLCKILNWQKKSSQENRQHENFKKKTIQKMKTKQQHRQTEGRRTARQTDPVHVLNLIIPRDYGERCSTIAITKKQTKKSNSEKGIQNQLSTCLTAAVVVANSNSRNICNGGGTRTEQNRRCPSTK